MAYRCEQAIYGRARDAIRCKVSGTVCAHQRVCLMEGRNVLTDGAMRCPARDGRMPEPVRTADKPAGETADRSVARKPEKVYRTAENPAGRTANKSTAKVQSKTGTAKKTAGRTASRKR